MPEIIQGTKMYASALQQREYSNSIFLFILDFSVAPIQSILNLF